MLNILASYLMRFSKIENLYYQIEGGYIAEFGCGIDRGRDSIIRAYGCCRKPEIFYLGSNCCTPAKWDKLERRMKSLFGAALHESSHPTHGCGGTTRYLWVSSDEITVNWDIPKPDVIIWKGDDVPCWCKCMIY